MCRGRTYRATKVGGTDAVGARIQPKTVDERAPKPIPADETDEASPGRPSQTRAPQFSGSPSSLPASASAALAAATAALAAFDTPAVAATTDAARPASEPRALIDLVPPAKPTAPTPASSTPPDAAAQDAAASYERFYGLAESPFALSPNPRFLFHWDSHDRVLRSIATAIGHHTGTILLTGEPGAGKTTLSRALVAQLGRRTLVSFVVDPVPDARELLQTVLVDFGVISRADAASGRLRQASRDDLRTTLRDFLASLSALQAVALIVIDNAQNLSTAVLQDLQVLAELAAEHKLLKVLLVGEPELAARLRGDEFREWAKLIGLRAELGPLSEADIADYVAHRLAVAGTTDPLFDADALVRLHVVTRGTPRDINLVADRALAIGHGISSRSIDEDLVDRAARDLDLLPEAPLDSTWRGGMLLAALLAAMMLAGAAGAGWMLRQPLLRVLARYGVSLSR
jgi:type II secretory pathway predicted ATPase ExeA